jgi:hypothetical protein
MMNGEAVCFTLFIEHSSSSIHHFLMLCFLR